MLDCEESPPPAFSANAIGGVPDDEGADSPDPELVSILALAAAQLLLELLLPVAIFSASEAFATRAFFFDPNTWPMPESDETLHLSLSVSCRSGN